MVDPVGPEDIVRRMRPTLRAGTVAVRKLYSPGALRDEEQRLHLFAVAEAGARVRVCTSPLPHETIVIDRRAMILAGRRHDGAREFTLTDDPTLVRGVHSLLCAAWENSVEPAVYLRRAAHGLDGPAVAVLRALSDGITDEAGARRLGVSLRTYRRRVADLLTAMDADSRFQAGVRVGQLGLAD